MDACSYPDIWNSPPPLTIICGHYGVGKTNLTLNLARRWAAIAPKLTLVDLDIVNPYFRSSDSIGWLASSGVEILGPIHARSSLDTPSLSRGIDEAIRDASPGHLTIVDVGGDPDGAKVLARYSGGIGSRDHLLLYVANFSRPEVGDAQRSLALLRAIESQSGLRASALVGNTHLQDETTAMRIISSLPKLQELSRLSGLPIAAVTAPEWLAAELTEKLAELPVAGLPGLPPIWPLRRLVVTPWEEVQADGNTLSKECT